MAGRAATLRVDIVGDARGIGRAVDETERKTSRLGKIGAAAGTALAGGLAVGAAAAVGFGVQSVKAASDVQQSFGALESVYGANASAAKIWADRAAQAVGLSKAEYASLSATVGAQLQGMGQSQREAVSTSDQLITTGADLAATFGGSVSDAVGAVGSLLRGERDPIERYGVSIKAADVEARLAAQGLDGLTGKARQQAEAQATLALLTEKTKGAQGAFGRESNTLAGQQERLRAQFDNVKAALGERLIPVATRLVGWLNSLVSGSGSTQGAFGRVAEVAQRYLTPVIAGARDAFSQVQGAIDRNRPALEKIGAVIARLAPVVGSFVGGSLRNMGFAFGVVLDVVSALVGWLDSAIKRVRDFGRAVANSPVGDVIGAVFHADPLATGAPGLVGAGPGYGGGGGLATASLATASLATLGLGGSSGSGGGGAGVVDARRVVVLDVGTLVGLDGPDVARQLAGILDAHDVQVGRAATFTGRAAT